MFGPSSVLYFFAAFYAVGLLLPFLAKERVQFTAVTTVFRPLSLSLIILHCIAAYLGDLHFVFAVFASTAILLLPLSVRQELRDEPKKIFQSNPLSKVLWIGLMIFCLLFFVRLFLGPSPAYGHLVGGLNISVQLILLLEILNKFRTSKSVHIFCAFVAGIVPLPFLALRTYLIIFQDDYAFSLVNESDLQFLSRLVIGASFFVLLSAVTNFQFQKVWNKERELRFDTERASLDSLLALSHARDGETGNRFLRKRQYIGVLIDNLRSKGWLTMPDLDAQMEQLFQVGSTKYDPKNAVDGINGHLDKLDQDTNMPGDSPSQTVRLMALADVYEVLTSKRPWKKTWTHKQAIDEITKMAGNRLDPKVVDAFLEEQIAFSAIADVWRDD